MGADFEDVVVVVEIEIDDEALLGGKLGEGAVALEVPGVVARDARIG